MKGSMGFLAALAAMLVVAFVSSVRADTYYAVNSGGSFYVGDTSVIKGFVGAIHNADNTYGVKAFGSGYSDAGIVLGFDGSLKLGDLNTFSVTSSAPLSVNLWLDTGNDGKFFAFDGDFPGIRTFTGLSNDSYVGTGTTPIDGNTVFSKLGGSVSGGTLDYLKSQYPNTRVALWVGLVGPGWATITDAEVNGVSISAAPAVPLPAPVFAGMALFGAMAVKRRFFSRSGN